MALKAGRVGVAPSQVDAAGNIIGGGSGSDSYTKAESDAKFATIASLTANEKEFIFSYDATSEKYGYKAGATGEFHPFEEAGGNPGWNKPANLTAEGLTYSRCSYVSGGYAIVDGVLYVDIIVTRTSTNAAVIQNLPAFTFSGSLYGLFHTMEDASDTDNYFANGQAVFGVGSGDIHQFSIGQGVNGAYVHAFGAVPMS